MQNEIPVMFECPTCILAISRATTASLVAAFTTTSLSDPSFWDRRKRQATPSPPLLRMFPQFQAQRLRIFHNAKPASGNLLLIPSVLFWIWKLVPAVALMIGVQPQSFRRRVHSPGHHLCTGHFELLEYGLPCASAKLVFPIVPLTSPVVTVAVHHVSETVLRFRIHNRRAAKTGLVWEDSGC